MIYIIVPTYARVNDTKKFIESIYESIHKNFVILIIDDHPDKLSLKNINQNDQLKILSSSSELWWVGSINLGIKTLIEIYNLKDKDTVVFANNDVQLNQDCFKLLNNELEKNRHQIIHPRTFNHEGVEVSSGSKIFSYFPYITSHPKNFKKQKQNIDMGTARFLMMGGSVLKKVGSVNKKLVQYGGDNDFTLSAKRFYDIETFIVRDAACIVDDKLTGMKNHNIQSIRDLYKSFFSIKSPNNIKYRYIFFKKFFGNLGAFFITMSMSLNTVVKFVLKKLYER